MDEVIGAITNIIGYFPHGKSKTVQIVFWSICILLFLVVVFCISVLMYPR